MPIRLAGAPVTAPGLVSRAGGWRTGPAGQAAAWLGSGVVAAVSTAWVMAHVVTTFGRQTTGLDFWNNTWLAVRGLLAGANIYGPAHAALPWFGRAWPVSPHLPGSLLWQAPFALLPLRAAVFTYAAVSIAAIWAGVFLLTRPRTPSAVLVAASCGALAICGGAGLITTLLGQPTGFTLLGLAMLVRARRPWLAGLGFMLAASTIQTGLPLALALLLLGGWPVVWRGTTLVLAASLPPVALEILNAGLHIAASSLISSALLQARPLASRVDLGALLQRLGVASVPLRVGAGLLVAGVALTFLARLPAHLRRISYPPVLCLVIAFTLVCTYHESYDMLLVSGAMVPVILVDDRSRAMLPVFALAGLSAALTRYNPVILSGDVIAMLGIGAWCALVARRAAVSASGTASSGNGAGSPVLAPGLQ